MLIGELVKRSGMSKDAIRFYERKGLITVGKKERRENNYKEYSENVLQRLLLIKQIKTLGFTLNEIDTFLYLWKDEDASCINMVSTVEKKITQINAEIQKLNELKTRLESSLSKCKSNNCEFEDSIPSCVRC